MNALDLNYINHYSPYKVWTENGTAIWPTGAYQFTINNESHQPSPSDMKPSTS